MTWFRVQGLGSRGSAPLPTLNAKKGPEYMRATSGVFDVEGLGGVDHLREGGNKDAVSRVQGIMKP